jgi:uncharacterized coiled-coil protein SlyX
MEIYQLKPIVSTSIKELSDEITSIKKDLEKMSKKISELEKLNNYQDDTYTESNKPTKRTKPNKTKED